MNDEENLTEEQREWLEKRQFMLNYKVKKEARPHLAYVIHCKTCGKSGILELPNKSSTLSERSINTAFLLQGWIFGPSGYECLECQNAWADAAIKVANEFANGRPTEIEGTVEHEQF